MVKIKEVKDRGVLSEGRDNGMGFGFLKNLGNDSYETVQPISPCKDYLNEPVFTENWGIGTSAFGLKYPDKLSIFEKEYAYMAIIIMKTKAGYYGYSKSFEDDVKNLDDNYQNMQKFINEFESKLNFKNKTVIEKANDNYYLVKLPIEWTKSTITISLYSLLLRTCTLYKEGDIKEYIDKYEYYLGDKNLLRGVNDKINIILKNKKLPSQPDIEKYIEQIKIGRWSPHNTGICSWNSKYEEESTKVLEPK